MWIDGNETFSGFITSRNVNYIFYIRSNVLTDSGIRHTGLFVLFSVSISVFLKCPILLGLLLLWVLLFMYGLFLLICCRLQHNLSVVIRSVNKIKANLLEVISNSLMGKIYGFLWHHFWLHRCLFCLLSVYVPSSWVCKRVDL